LFRSWIIRDATRPSASFCWSTCFTITMRVCSFPPKRSQKSFTLPARAPKPSSSIAPLPASSRCRARNIWPSRPARLDNGHLGPIIRLPQTGLISPVGYVAHAIHAEGGARLRGISEAAPGLTPEPVLGGCARLLELAACRLLHCRFAGDGLRRREGCFCLEKDRLSYVYVRTNKSNRLKTLVAK